jgi:release factor glutamine methyltransferase
MFSRISAPTLTICANAANLEKRQRRSGFHALRETGNKFKLNKGSKSCRIGNAGAKSISLQFRSEEVYAPEEDTFLLLKAALAEARPEDRALEVGCGSGFISLELASGVTSLLATDINPYAVLATKAKAVKAKGIEVVRADMFQGIKGKFDLIIFNPPYLPTTPEERSDQWINYALDGGESGRETIDRFLKCLPDHLYPGGRALLLISSLTGLRDVQEMAAAKCLTANTVANAGCFFEQLYVLKLEVAHKHRA